MSLQRAYSLVVFKSIDEEQRIIEGIASTPTLDRQGDVMVPEGAQYQLPHPLLLNHDQDRPIGHVLSATVTASGIRIRAQVAKGVTPWIDEAWSLIKSGLIRGLSVGARLRDFDRTATGLRVKAWDWLETSAVVIPANQQASILMVKSLDAASLPVSGEKPRSRSLNPPGVTGQMTGTQMTHSEQLVAAREEMATKSTRLNDLVTQEINESGLSTEAAQERDTIKKSLTELSGRVESLALLEKTMIQSGQLTVVQAPVRQVEKPRVQVVQLGKGIRFARVAMALMAGRGSRADSLDYAKQFSNTPEVFGYIKNDLYRKAEAGSAIVESPGWGGELVNPDTMLTEFVELLRAGTIIGRVPNFRRASFNIPVITQVTGSTFNWVGGGNPKPVGELAFESATLTWAKVAGIVVMHEELVRFSRPNADTIVRDDMVEQCGRFLDEQFIQVGISAGANNPASITNGVSAPNATGTTAAALRHDLNIALKVFTDAGVSTSGIVIVMTSALARGISLLTTTLGVPEFPSMTPEGGSLIGYQVIVSDSVDSGTMVLFQPREIFLADDGRVTLDASREATLDMSGSTSATFSLWQNNCVAIRAEQFIKWQKRRSAGTVAVIDTAAYAPA